MERELLRFLEGAEGKSRFSYMQGGGKTAKFRGLRKKVQVLNQELVSREEENDDLRRDILFTRKSELEAQVQAYADECARLRDHVSELEEDRERLLRAEQLHSEQEKALFALEQQNDDLRRSLAKFQKDSTKMRRSSNRDRKRVNAARSEIAGLKQEVQRLRTITQSESPSKKRAKDSPSPVPKSVQVTQAEIKRELGYEFSIPELLQRLQQFSTTAQQPLPDCIKAVLPSSDDISPESLFVAMRKQGFYWEREEARMLLSHVHHPGDCPVSELLSFLGKQAQKSPQKPAATVTPSLQTTVTPHSSPPTTPTVAKVQLSEVRTVLRHVAYRLQLQRVPKAKVMSLIIGGNPDRFRVMQVPQLEGILAGSPFDVTDQKEARLLARFLIETEAIEPQLPEDSILTLKKSVGDIVEKLNRSLDPWEGFSPEEEESFDQHIGAVLNRNKTTFKAACKGYDHDKSEVISFSDFEEVLENLEIEFSQKEKHYLRLLFYSSLQELDMVPYKELLRAYTEGGEAGNSSSQESVEPSDAEVRGMIQKYLQLIANAMVGRKRTVKDVFQTTAGCVTPQQFYEGYCSLGLPNINQQSLGMLIDALQGDEERPDYSISLAFLEEVFSHYGVNPESSRLKKQVSNLETPVDSKGDLASSGEFAGRSNTSGKDHSLQLSEQSPFLTDAKQVKDVPPTSDLKQWDISDSEEGEADYQDEDFESGSARSI